MKVKIEFHDEYNDGKTYSEYDNVIEVITDLIAGLVHIHTKDRTISARLDTCKKIITE